MKRLKEAVSHSRGGSGGRNGRKRRGNGARRKSPPRPPRRKSVAVAQAEEAIEQLEAARQAAAALRKRWSDMRGGDPEDGDGAVRSEAAVLIQALWRASLVMWSVSWPCAAPAGCARCHIATSDASGIHRSGL